MFANIFLSHCFINTAYLKRFFKYVYTLEAISWLLLLFLIMLRISSIVRSFMCWFPKSGFIFSNNLVLDYYSNHSSIKLLHIPLVSLITCCSDNLLFSIGSRPLVICSLYLSLSSRAWDKLISGYFPIDIIFFF